MSLLPEIARLLLRGGVIAVPTDTIYGLAACSLTTRALKRIYAIKGREASKPMAICLDGVNSFPRWCDTSGIEDELLSSLLPGPVTVVLPRLLDDPLPPLLNQGVNEIGIRVPDSLLVCKLSAALGQAFQEEIKSGTSFEDLHLLSVVEDASAIPLVLTSANASGATSTLEPSVGVCIECMY